MSTGLAFVLAYVARKPYNVDIVYVGKMSFQLAAIFAFVLKLLLAYFARVQLYMLCTLARCVFKFDVVLNFFLYMLQEYVMDPAISVLSSGASCCLG